MTGNRNISGDGKNHCFHLFFLASKPLNSAQNMSKNIFSSESAKHSANLQKSGKKN